jgi:hypothetical protein
MHFCKRFADVHCSRARVTAAGVLCLLCLGLPGCNRTSTGVSFKDADAIIEEITTVQPMFRAVTPDHLGYNLAYIQARETGRRLVIFDLRENYLFEVPTTNEVNQIFGWSPCARYLAFSEVSPVLLSQAIDSKEFSHATSISLYDRATRSFERILSQNHAPAVESSFVWLKTNTYFFSVKPIGKNYAQKFVGDCEARTNRQVFNYISDFVLMSSSEAAFVQNGNIHKCLLDSPKYSPILRISNFEKTEFDTLRWLRYEPRNQLFLFCARPQSSSWRYLFEYNPSNDVVRQITEVDTYNGQWLAGGEGFAFVANYSNSFELALRPNDRSAHTNLFVDGCVVSYTVAPDGRRVYAIASETVEPQGIWEYDLLERKLRKIVGAENRSIPHSRWIVPREVNVRFQSIDVPVFIYPPRALATGSGPKSRRKHPAVIYLPPSTWQAQKAFDIQAQLMANLGFYFVGVNYPGCDGYGLEYSQLTDATLTTEAVSTVCRYLTQTEHVDPERLFLSANSSGCSVASQLLFSNPSRWAGVFLDHPPGIHHSGLKRGDRLPPMLIVSGDQDRFLPSIKTFETWAYSNKVSLTTMVHTNCGHMNWKAGEVASAYTAAARLFLGHSR